MGRNILRSDACMRVKACDDENSITTTTQQSSDQRIVYFTGDVTEEIISVINSRLINLAAKSNDPINLVISTCGGYIYEMFSLYDTIKFLNCPVHTIGLGKVMSAGVLLLAAGEKGRRLIGPSTRVMIHAITSGVWGNIFDIENQIGESQELQRMMTDAMVEETNFTKEKLVKLYKSKTDMYFSASECIKLGIADKILGNKKK